MLDCSVGFCLKVQLMLCTQTLREPLGWVFPFKNVSEKMKQLYQLSDRTWRGPEIWKTKTKLCQKLPSTLKPKDYGICTSKPELAHECFSSQYFLTNLTQTGPIKRKWEKLGGNIIFSSLLWQSYNIQALESSLVVWDPTATDSHWSANFLLRSLGTSRAWWELQTPGSPNHNLKGHSTDSYTRESVLSQGVQLSLWKQLYNVFCGSGETWSSLRK